MQGKIYKILSNFYYVSIDNEIIECKAKGKFKNTDTELLVGDDVLIEFIDNNKGNIIEVLERRNKLVRPSVANVDKLIIVLSIKQPEPDYLLLDKQIAYCVKHNIIPVICFTKIDKDTNESYKQIQKVYKDIGYNVYCVSSKENIGIDKLKKELQGCVCAFTGNSGVGKSTLINALLKKELMIEGNISVKSQRGKHTTRHVELIREGELCVVDTPGFSILEMFDIRKDELIDCFEEMKRFKYDCEFRDCTHIKETKCGVKKAIEEGIIDKGRYDRYIKIYNSI